MTLPPVMLKDLGLKTGDAVKLEYKQDRGEIIITRGRRENQLPLALKLRKKL